MELSIVTTLYCSAPYLRDFYTRSCAAAERITPDFEIVFVNDGSPDDSLARAVELCRSDARVRVIDLSRNFGHHKAMMTGLMHARGRFVFLTDCDLEVEPETLPLFYEKLQEAEADVAYGVQDKREGRWVDRLAGRMFYTLFNWLSSDPLPTNLLTVRLMSQRYVSALVAHREREVLIGGLWVITGFKQVPVVVHKVSKGGSTYNLPRKIAVLVNAVTSFSHKPLLLIFYLGSGISLLASGTALALIVRRLVFGTVLHGWLSLMVSIWLLGGLTIFCLGILGIYLSRIFTETKQRPYTIVRDLYEHSQFE